MPGRMLEGLAWLRNALDFPIRQAIRLRRAGCRLPAEPKDGLFPAEAIPEVQRLVREYRLESWQRDAGRTEFAASLFYLQMLERALAAAGVALPNRLHAVDAGCGDWFYAPALHGLLRWYGTAGKGPRNLTLDGVELDAYSLYAGFHSRRDWAEAYAAGLEGARYLPQDIRAYREPAAVAFMLFPFLFPADLRRWGLPRRYLAPAELLAHVVGLVEPGGALVIANLGAAERAEQHRLLAQARLKVAWWGEHRSPLFRYEQGRYVTVVRRPL